MDNTSEVKFETTVQAEPAVPAPVVEQAAAPVEEATADFTPEVVEPTPVVTSVICPACSGTGLLGDPSTPGNKVCDACNGTGK